MKRAALALFLSGFLFHLHADELEVRLIRFSGEVPQPAEILRLAKAGLLPSTDSYTAEVDSTTGAFFHSTKQPLAVQEFDDLAKPKKTVTRFPGVSFSGKTTQLKKDYIVDLVFSSLALDGIRMDRTPGGATFPQTIFRTWKITTSITATPGEWSIVAPGTTDAGSVLLVMLRKSTES